QARGDSAGHQDLRLGCVEAGRRHLADASHHLWTKWRRTGVLIAATFYSSASICGAVRRSNGKCRWRRNVPAPRLLTCREKPARETVGELEAAHVDAAPGAVRRPVVGAVLQFPRTLAVRISLLLLVPV